MNKYNLNSGMSAALFGTEPLPTPTTDLAAEISREAGSLDQEVELNDGSSHSRQESINEESKDEILAESKEEKNEESKETITEDSNETIIQGINDSMIESSRETRKAGKAKGRKGRSKTVIYDGVEYRSATFLLREDIHKALKHYGVDNGVPDYHTVNKALAKFLGIKY